MQLPPNQPLRNRDQTVNGDENICLLNECPFGCRAFGIQPRPALRRLKVKLSGNYIDGLTKSERFVKLGTWLERDREDLIARESL